MNDIEARITDALREVSRGAPTVDEISIPTRRHGRHGLWLAAVAAAVAAIVIPLGVVFGVRTIGASHPSPEAPIATAGFTSPASSYPHSTPYYPPCRAGQLTGTISVLPAGMNQVYDYVYLTNTGDFCHLQGIPTVVALWHRSAKTSDRGYAASLSPTPLRSGLPFDPAPAYLGNGDTAVVLLVSSMAGCQPGMGYEPGYKKLSLSFPGGPRNVVAKVDPKQVVSDSREALALGCNLQVTEVSLKTW